MHEPVWDSKWAVALDRSSFMKVHFKLHQENYARTTQDSSTVLHMYGQPPVHTTHCRGLIIILLVGIGPALLRGPLHSHMSGAGTASARVVLLQDNALGQLCLMQQVARAETGTPDANAGGPLPAELALDSSLLQWAAKVRGPEPTAPSFHHGKS